MASMEQRNFSRKFISVHFRLYYVVHLILLLSKPLSTTITTIDGTSERHAMVGGGAEWESSSLCRLTDKPKQMKGDPPIKSAI